MMIIIVMIITIITIIMIIIVITIVMITTMIMIIITNTHTQYTIMSIFQIAVENGPFDDLHIMIYLQTMAIPVARCNYQRAIDL